MLRRLVGSLCAHGSFGRGYRILQQFSQSFVPPVVIEAEGQKHQPENEEAEDAKDGVEFPHVDHEDVLAQDQGEREQDG